MITTVELARAKEAVTVLLEQLGLAAYLFDLEWHEDSLLLRVDCAVCEGWQSLSFPVDKALLVLSANDPGAREQLLADWRLQLRDCKTEPWIQAQSRSLR